MRALAAWVCCAMAVLALTIGACERRTGSKEGAGSGGGGTSKGVVRAVVTVPALAGIVGPLLPEGSELTILMKPGRSEHGYEFTPTDIAALGRADLVVYVGLGLEPKVEAFMRERANGRRRAVCFAEAVGVDGGKGQRGHESRAESSREGKPEDAQSVGEPKAAHPRHPGEDAGGTPAPPVHPGGADAAADHSEDEHHHGLVDPHLWLDPVLVMELVPAVGREVEAVLKDRGELDEAARARLAGAEERLVSEVKKVDEEYRERLGSLPAGGRAIVTHHAAFGRLAARYGLRVAEVIRPIEGVEPTPGQIAEVAAAVKKEGVSVIFVEPQFNSAAAERLAGAVGVKVGRLDPLGDGDWFKMMRANLNELVGKLGSETKESGAK